MKLTNQDFDAIRRWMHRNARPLDLARWQYHFESGSAEAVLQSLSAYQNEDGGFGHGLEADCWNPASAPMQTWAAACILRELNAPKEHPIVAGILRYLGSGAHFVDGLWQGAIPSNNDFPHARGGRLPSGQGKIGVITRRRVWRGLFCNMECRKARFTRKRKGSQSGPSRILLRAAQKRTICMR